jgi:hypothetical protein
MRAVVAHWTTSSPPYSQFDLERAYRLRFAFAVAKPGGHIFRLDEHNSYAGPTKIVEAVAGGACFVVEVLDEILAVDQDDPEQESDLMNLCDRALAQGLRPILLASGSRGRHHLFVRIEDRSTREELAGAAQQRRLDVRRSIRPPLAPHRRGGASQLVFPKDPEEALRDLRPRRPRPPLTERMERLLAYGEGENRYPSRSEAEEAVALAAVNADWCYEEFREALLDDHNAIGDKARELRGTPRGPWTAERYLALTWQKALERWVQEPPFLARSELLAEIQAAIDSSPWPGRTGTTDYAILEAMLEIAQEAGSPVFTASHRQIAERAGVSHKTVSKAVSAEQRLGRWVERLRIGTEETATEWQLRVPEGNRLPRGRRTGPLLPHTPHRGVAGNGEITRLSPGRDAFRRSGLGKAAFQVLQHLDPREPRNRAELARATGRHRSTVSACLRDLWEFGLAKRVEGGWVQGLPGALEALDTVAEVLGTGGAGERQRDQHRYLEHKRRRVDPSTGEILEA